MNSFVAVHELIYCNKNLNLLPSAKKHTAIKIKDVRKVRKGKGKFLVAIIADVVQA